MYIILQNYKYQLYWHLLSVLKPLFQQLPLLRQVLLRVLEIKKWLSSSLKDTKQAVNWGIRGFTRAEPVLIEYRSLLGNFLPIHLYWARIQCIYTHQQVFNDELGKLKEFYKIWVHILEVLQKRFETFTYKPKNKKKTPSSGKDS